MRSLFAGFVPAGLICGGLICSVALGQEPQRANPAIRPAQGQQVQPGQQLQPGQQVQPRQPAQPGQPVQPGQPRQPGEQSQTGTADQQIAACIYGECHNEIEIAKFAESKAQNDEVREFAQRMVRDHSASCEEMKRAAGQLADSHGQATSSRTSSRSTSGNPDWLSIKKEIGQKCLESIKKELSSKQGADFDECFIGQQVGAHMKMVDELQVLRNHVSSDLQQKIDKDLQTAQQHLQLAKQLAQKLKDGSSERVTRRPENK